MTVQMNLPVVAKLNMPKDGPHSTLGMTNALTVILAEDNAVYYYEGSWEQAFTSHAIKKTTLAVKDGIGQVIREKQLALDQLKLAKPDTEGRDGLMLLIKASKFQPYITKNLPS